MATDGKGSVQRARATAAADTRARIVAAASELIVGRNGGVPVDEIARRAGVAVQSIYDHFGSKGGLVMAMVDDLQRETGLYDAIGRVFRSPDGETAARRMVVATFTVWHEGWAYVEFMLHSRYADRFVSDAIAQVDLSRHAHLWAICQRLQDEGRLRARRSARWAADQVFALTTPTVYEELVVRRAWRPRAATQTVLDGVLKMILREETRPVADPPPDWPALVAAAREKAGLPPAGREPSTFVE